jgi:hypothetical protein
VDHEEETIMGKLGLNLDGFAAVEELDEVAATLIVLCSYATSKALAMRYRIAGDIPKALNQEDKCERQYKRLPEWARW